jgi:hypothetical protein
MVGEERAADGDGEVLLQLADAGPRAGPVSGTPSGRPNIADASMPHSIGWCATAMAVVNGAWVCAPDSRHAGRRPTTPCASPRPHLGWAQDHPRGITARRVAPSGRSDARAVIGTVGRLVRQQLTSGSRQMCAFRLPRTLCRQDRLSRRRSRPWRSRSGCSTPTRRSSGRCCAILPARRRRRWRPSARGSRVRAGEPACSPCAIPMVSGPGAPASRGTSPTTGGPASSRTSPAVSRGPRPCPP